MITEVRYGDVIARTCSASLEDDEWMVEKRSTGESITGLSKKKALKLAKRIARDRFE
jgi:hypothetical protein